MRPGKLFARLLILSIATVACLVLAFVGTLYWRSASDEPFSGASVMASPRDLQVVTQAVRLSSAPDLVLSRGMLYADGNAALGTAISRFVLDAPVFVLKASPGSGPTSAPASLMSEAGTLVEQLAGLGYDNLTIRRGTVQITSGEGTGETLNDVEAEVTGKRKGAIAARGSFSYRGQRLKFDASVTLPTDRRPASRLATRIQLKSAFVDANFDGSVDVTQDLQLAGTADVSLPSLRRVARWFSVPVPNAEGLNATALRGQFTWARSSLAFEQAKVSIDGNEANGSVTLNLGGERPLVDGTLAFATMDLLPYVESLRPQTFGFERPVLSWTNLDLTFPLVRYVDADLRISAPKVTLKGFELGRTAATLSVRSGKLLADVAEVELGSGSASLQFTADTNEIVPRYTLKGRVENLDGNQVAAALLFSPTWTGKSAFSFDVMGIGQTPGDMMRSLTGKATLHALPGMRAPLDAKALRALAKSGAVTGWAGITKGQTQFDQLDLRFTIAGGTATAETVQARAGTHAFAVSGSVNLPEASLDLRIASRAGTPADRVLKPSDFLGADMVRLAGPLAAPSLSIADREEERLPLPAQLPPGVEAQ